MNTSTLEKQFASVAEGRSNIADVRTPRGNLIILSERLGERFRPLLEFMARQISAESVPAEETGWTDEKNSRRMDLINKKYDGKLTAAEKRELKVLQQEGEVKQKGSGLFIKTDQRKRPDPVLGFQQVDERQGGSSR